MGSDQMVAAYFAGGFSLPFRIKTCWRVILGAGIVKCSLRGFYFIRRHALAIGFRNLPYDVLRY